MGAIGERCTQLALEDYVADRSTIIGRSSAPCKRWSILGSYLGGCDAFLGPLKTARHPFGGLDSTGRRIIPCARVAKHVHTYKDSLVFL